MFVINNYSLVKKREKKREFKWIESNKVQKVL